MPKEVITDQSDPNVKLVRSIFDTLESMVLLDSVDPTIVLAAAINALGHFAAAAASPNLHNADQILPYLIDIFRSAFDAHRKFDSPNSKESV